MGAGLAGRADNGVDREGALLSRARVDPAVHVIKHRTHWVKNLIKTMKPNSCFKADPLNRHARYVGSQHPKAGVDHRSSGLDWPYCAAISYLDQLLIQLKHTLCRNIPKRGKLELSCLLMMGINLCPGHETHITPLANAAQGSRLSEDGSLPPPVPSRSLLATSGHMTPSCRG